jgi:hypothetical protein
MRARRALLAMTGTAVATMSVAVAGTPAPRYPAGTVVSSVRVAERVVALTFDDGPRPPFTDVILDVLRDQGIVATFLSLARTSNAIRNWRGGSCAKGTRLATTVGGIARSTASRPKRHTTKSAAERAPFAGPRASTRAS